MIPSPCFVLDEQKLENNLSLIKHVADQAQVEIILAFKGFAMWSAFPIVRKYISGATSSSVHEMMLCNEHMQTQSHTYAVAYKASEIDQILAGSSHITFNSLSQLEQFGRKAHEQDVSVGLRINPEYSDVATDLYNPSSPTSRLGVKSEALNSGLPEYVEGLHFHVLCESDAEALEKTLEAVEQRFGHLLPQIKWLNMGGGHLMTRKGYDTDRLIQLLKTFKAKHNLHLILEPGSAFAWETGTLKTTVLDIVDNGGMKTAIIDGSFTCHMPDCLEMPYRPNLAKGYKEVTQAKYQYRLGGVSCLAGDFLEAYSFEEPLQIGDEIEFLDMIHYTMVKTSTFNGVQHPAIGILRKDRTFELVKTFEYDDYKNRLS
ncbi:carboxynorspermidine decarboxylase [Reichenbachiella carrageenanivorans]|uniref:Carboxynorspermidine/carboxyspermidine decarboxylase n=1 Tax=Reichenbachiella carrageenanivorans TaxID=2979869 RepID=A0ABY6CXW8_9BACT|nr:carboxynorspermidine decarboxylase [Reichenbachiella carrageenanivorans]UXX78756.1 carboxynorspermidine decarboxylase [Reichenbachiella carrageenanivorans]